jgi:hypothetical protein
VDVENIPGFMDGREKAQEGARKHVSGHPLDIALMRLAFVTQPIQPKELRETVERHAREFVFSHLFGVEKLSSDGLVTDTAPSAVMSNEEAKEERFRKEMYQQAAQFGWPVKVDFAIAPARQQILDEHAPRLRDIAFLVSSHPLVPVGRERIYARGILAGLQGDWLIATHLLIPQLEYSIRLVFQQNDILPSTLNAGLQKVHLLGWLLTHSAMPEIFGEDMAFDLRALLIEVFGCNLRNDFAHGLIPEGAFYTPATQYLWWLILRLLCIPIVKAGN